MLETLDLRDITLGIRWINPNSSVSNQSLLSHVYYYQHRRRSVKISWEIPNVKIQ